MATVKELEAELEKLRAELETLKSERSGFTEKVKEAEQALRDEMANMSEKADATRQDAEEKIRENPIAAVGVAFLAGIVLSKIFRA